MGTEFGILAASAASIGLVHTLTGPDHYLPFIVIGRARNWSLTKMLSITALCGFGHVLGSVLLGFLGIGLGLAVGRMNVVEGVRGDLAAWLLISFGLVYGVWGLRKALRKRPHSHTHTHMDGTVHHHHHSHQSGHAHPHVDGKTGTNITPWALFIIFILGPCEPLIPILMYPAAKNSLAGLIVITGIFSLVTILTMMAMVFLAERGFKLIPTKGLERFSHALAGLAILGSGLAIQFLGL